MPSLDPTYEIKIWLIKVDSFDLKFELIHQLIFIQLFLIFTIVGSILKKSI